MSELKKTKAIFIPVDYKKPVSLVYISGYESIQGLVGGYIQGLPIYQFDNVKTSDQFIMYVNEEGLLKSLVANKRADNIISRFANGKGYLFAGGLVGDAVLSRLDEEGDEMDIPTYISDVFVKPQ